MPRNTYLLLLKAKLPPLLLYTKAAEYTISSATMARLRSLLLRLKYPYTSVIRPPIPPFPRIIVELLNTTFYAVTESLVVLKNADERALALKMVSLTFKESIITAPLGFNDKSAIDPCMSVALTFIFTLLILTESDPSYLYRKPASHADSICI